MATEITEGGRRIEIERNDRSECAMSSSERLVAEIVEYPATGAVELWVKVTDGYESSQIILTREQGAELRHWLTARGL